MSFRRSLALASLVGVLATVGLARPAAAHPLGNLTVNTSLAVVIAPGGARAQYVLDLAELPTVTARQQIDTDDDGMPSGAEQQARATAECGRRAAGATIDGRPLEMAATAPVLTFPEGQGGLPTLRLVCELRADVTVPASERPLAVHDGNDADRIGWREIVLRGDGVTLTGSDAPTASPSALLTAYPGGGASSHQRDARTTVRAGGAAAVVSPGTAATPSAGRTTRGLDGLTQRMNRLVGERHFGLGVGVLAALLAFLLGALHSLAPGHGKTLMAATVLARRAAAARQVLTIGTTVAFTHTAGVLVLGSAIWTSQTLAPDRVLPWLSLASGALLVATGLAFAAARLRGRRPLHAHDHGHHHGHEGGHEHEPHHHHEHHHDHHHAHGHASMEARPLTRRWLVTMGVAGGLVPTPSALVVLLGAAALGRTWFGVVLVAVYGVGMATTLLVAGVALVRLQGWLERHWFGSRWLATTLRVAPFVTAGALVLAGVTLAARSLPSV